MEADRGGAAVVVLMGPAGSGKSTVGVRLAERLGWRFLEGDTLHPAGNVEAMRAGRPLSEAQRAPWLAAIAACIRRSLDEGGRLVVACSALRRTHRRVLAPKGAEGRVRFVYLDVPREVLAERIAGRRGHFFPEELLDSQLDALEPPGPGDDVLVVDGTLPPDVLAATIAEDLLGEGERR